MFSKLDQSKSINTSGIGLGLNICKKIVEALDGSIQVEDNPDGTRGATFKFIVKCELPNSAIN